MPRFHLAFASLLFYVLLSRFFTGVGIYNDHEHGGSDDHGKDTIQCIEGFPWAWCCAKYIPCVVSIKS